MSYTFELGECTPEKADLFASLMGDLGYENQEAVIVAEYVQSGQKFNAIELCVQYRHLDGVMSAINRAGITDYTVDTTNKTIKIGQYDNLDDITDLENKLDKLQKELGENYENSTYKFAISKVHNREVRRNIYKKWTRTFKGEERNRKLHTYITKATEVLEQARKQGGTVKADWEMLKSLKFRSLTDRYYNKKE